MKQEFSYITRMTCSRSLKGREVAALRYKLARGKLLGDLSLEKVNPGIIMVSIPPFGQTGPCKDYQAPGIVAWAMGGQMYQYGDIDLKEKMTGKR